MTDPLKSFLSGIHRPVNKAAVDNVYVDFGLGQNPFPPNRMIVPDVIYGQDQSVNRFFNTCVEIFSAKSPQRRAVAVVAGTGGGKTHFLQYCRHSFPKIADKFGQRFVLSEFVAGSGKMIDLIRNILRDADELCKQLDGCDFLTALLRELHKHKNSADYLDAIQIMEVRECLKRLMLFPSAKPDVAFDLAIGIARKWINAETLSQTEKRRLGIVSRISTPAFAVKVVRELFSLASRLQLFQGLFLCIDEIESLFTRGLSPAQIQAFLQDIRYFYDESVRDEQGFDLLLLTASTTTGAENLLKFNPPIFQRFGYERDNRLLLNQIGSVGDAVEFSYKYVDYFADKWKAENIKLKPPQAARTIISPKQIEVAFLAASAGARAAAPGSLLDLLHKTVQARFGTAAQDLEQHEI
jgi:hypothetical protein